MNAERRYDVDPALTVPLYYLKKRLDVPPATIENPQGAVSEAIAGAKTLFGAGDHFLKLLIAPIPHTNGLHHVGWFDTQEHGVGSWTQDSWRRLAKDHIFWKELTAHIWHIQRINPRMNMYMLMGFTAPGTPKEHQMYRSLQSIDRGHLHYSEEISPDFLPVRYLEHSNPADAGSIVAFSDIAGKMSVDRFCHILAGFGRELRVAQSVGHLDGEPSFTPMDRLYFGFDRADEALGATVELLDALKETWDDHTLYIATHSTLVGSQNVMIKAGPVPQASLIFPSVDLRRRWGVGDEFSVYVHPFGVIGPPHITTHGGAMLSWDPEPLNQHTMPRDTVLRSLVMNGNGGH